MWHAWAAFIDGSCLRGLVQMSCPGHAGVQSGRQVDRLALTAPVAGAIVMDTEHASSSSLSYHVNTKCCMPGD